MSKIDLFIHMDGRDRYLIDMRDKESSWQIIIEATKTGFKTPYAGASFDKKHIPELIRFLNMVSEKGDE